MFSAIATHARNYSLLISDIDRHNLAMIAFLSLRAHLTHHLVEQFLLSFYLFSFDQPYRAQNDTFKIEFPNLKVLEFRFHAIQLNRLNWRDYIDRPNPEAIMQVTTSWEAKGQRSIVSLQLEQKIGQLPEALNDRVSSLSSERLSSLAIALLNFNSIDDLSNWLNANG